MYDDQELATARGELRRLVQRRNEAIVGGTTALIIGAVLLAAGGYAIGVAALLGGAVGWYIALRAARARDELVRRLLLARRYRDLDVIGGGTTSMRRRHAVARAIRRGARSQGVRRGRGPLRGRAARVLSIADALDDPRRAVEPETLILAGRVAAASRASALCAEEEPGSELDALLCELAARDRAA